MEKKKNRGMRFLFGVLVVLAIFKFFGGEDEKNEEKKSEEISKKIEKEVKENTKNGVNNDITISKEEENKKEKREVQSFESDKDESEYIFFDSNQRKISEKDIEGMTKTELRLARNEIYARYGRMFDSKDLKEYFESKAWYSAEIPVDEFNANDLNDIEKYNINFFIDAEKNVVEEEEISIEERNSILSKEDKLTIYKNMQKYSTWKLDSYIIDPDTFDKYQRWELIEDKSQDILASKMDDNEWSYYGKDEREILVDIKCDNSFGISIAKDWITYFYDYALERFYPNNVSEQNGIITYSYIPDTKEGKVVYAFKTDEEGNLILKSVEFYKLGLDYPEFKIYFELSNVPLVVE